MLDLLIGVFCSEGAAEEPSGKDWEHFHSGSDASLRRAVPGSCAFPFGVGNRRADPGPFHGARGPAVL